MLVCVYFSCLVRTLKTSCKWASFLYILTYTRWFLLKLRPHLSCIHTVPILRNTFRSIFCTLQSSKVTHTLSGNISLGVDGIFHAYQHGIMGPGQGLGWQIFLFLITLSKALKIIRLYACIWVLLASLLPSVDILAGEMKQKYKQVGNESQKRLMRNKS